MNLKDFMSFLPYERIAGPTVPISFDSLARIALTTAFELSPNLSSCPSP
jgi:hypothetical protein